MSDEPAPALSEGDADCRQIAGHVWQINELLAATQYRISGRARGDRLYRLVRQAHDRHGSETSEHRAVSGIE